MTLQPDDFWSFYEWLLRPGAFLESALLQGIVLIILAIVLGLIVAYVISAARYGPGEGFYAVARAIRDFFVSDLPGTSPGRIYALARLAFKEAIRRKVLFVIGLFVVILLLAGWYLNPESDDPARLYISFVLTATNYLILALALFISAFSLPQDIESRTIYTIVTKPVRATEIVLGRMLGFIGVGTVMLVPMGLASYIFVKRGLDHTHQEVVEAEEDNGRIIGETDFVRRHSHQFTIEPGETQGLTDFVRGHRHVVTRVDDATFTVGPPTGHLRARIPSYGSIQFYDRSGEKEDAGIDVGAERLAGGYSNLGISRLIGVARETRKMEHGYVEGGTLGAAEFTFDDVTEARYPNGIPVDMSIRAYRSYKGDIETGIRGSLTMRNPDTKAESNPIAFIVDEYQVDERTLPLEIGGTDANGETRTLQVFDDLVTEDGRLQIVLRCLDRSQYLGVTKSGIYLRPAESSFEWNLTKAYLSIWLQMTMVIAFGVMFSTFLSGPVAMVATAVCVLLGFSAESIYDTRHYIDSNVSRGGGPIESLVRLVKQDAMTTELDVEGVANTLIKSADAIIVYTMDAVATALPNLPKMVRTAEYAASGFDIFNAILGRHAVATLGYCLLAFLISYFFLKSREIAA
ncbi:ABC transporter permease [Roseiconus nitratireducens]|uniref:ABC transporter permease n=1 Tax=Roseiconus nitratireducens TaxID=2605748 RepID=A0A5M6DHZ2_9BACT|nr:ABC transporter permease [Roseiconus nitratireducens]KAA5547164.1 ABC transporter permease [Roseiconus nitratireducens]